MTETQRALALPNSAVLNMAPGANLPAYVQAVSGIAILSVERERELAERLYTRSASIRRGSWCWRIFASLCTSREAIRGTDWQKLT